MVFSACVRCLSKEEFKSVEGLTALSKSEKMIQWAKVSVLERVSSMESTL